MDERRKVERIKVELKVFWEGALTQMEGIIVDLSTTGCFILTDDQVRTGELIRVEIRPPKDGALYIWGEVVYQIAEMGFALRFTGGDEEDIKRLGWLIRANLHEAKRNDAAKSSVG